MWNWDRIDQESLAKRDRLKPINVAEEIIQRWHHRAESWALGSNHILGLVEGNKTGKKMAKGWNFFSTEKTKQEYLLFWWHSTCNNHSYLVNEYMKQKEQYGVFLFFVEEHYGVGKRIRFKWNYLASYFSLSPINYISCNQ